jgi:hypothetical protein
MLSFFVGPVNSPVPKNYLYNPTQSILVLGDGDFTFSRALSKTLNKLRSINGVKGPLKLHLTSYDSEREVKEKYKNASECVELLKKGEGVTVKHGVDATNLGDSFPPETKFDRIIFNFPHSGQQRVHINRNLLRDFFASAKHFLAPLGEIHVALKIKPPYSNWEIEKQAEESGMFFRQRLPFYLDHYPGYYHRTTDPNAVKFEADYARTFVFRNK